MLVLQRNQKQKKKKKKKKKKILPFILDSWKAEREKERTNAEKC